MGSRRTGLAVGALALLAAAAPSRAADCARTATQTDMNLCAAQAAAAADEALNAAYGTLLEEPLMAERLDRLRAAERAWIGYRDAQCAFEGAGYEGGSMQPLVVEGCAEALTKRRTVELKRALSCAKDQAGC